MVDVASGKPYLYSNMICVQTNNAPQVPTNVKKPVNVLKVCFSRYSMPSEPRAKPIKLAMISKTMLKTPPNAATCLYHVFPECFYDASAGAGVNETSRTAYLFCR